MIFFSHNSGLIGFLLGGVAVALVAIVCWVLGIDSTFNGAPC